MTQNLDQENLKKIAQNILDPKKTLADLIPRIGDLRTLLERRTLLKLEPEVNLGEGRTLLDSGVAVSPLVWAKSLSWMRKMSGIGLITEDNLPAATSVWKTNVRGRRNLAVPL